MTGEHHFHDVQQRVPKEFRCLGSFMTRAVAMPKEGFTSPNHYPQEFMGIQVYNHSPDTVWGPFVIACLNNCISRLAGAWGVSRQSNFAQPPYEGMYSSFPVVLVWGLLKCLSWHQAKVSKLLRRFHLAYRASAMFPFGSGLAYQQLGLRR